MALSEIKIYDEEYKTVHETYKPKAEEIEKEMEKYFKTLDSIVEDKILEGDTALALKNFAQLARLVVASKLDGIMEKHKTAAGDFIEETATQDDTKF